MGTPLVRGRDFADSDRANIARVAIVDERSRGSVLAGADPIGQTIHRGEAGRVHGRRRRSRGAVREPGGGNRRRSARPTSRTRRRRRCGRLRWIAVKSAADPAASMRAVRSALAEIDPDLPLSDVQTMTSAWRRSLGSQRLAMALATMFGGRGAVPVAARASTACWRTSSPAARASSASGWRSAAPRGGIFSPGVQRRCGPDWRRLRSGSAARVVLATRSRDSCSASNRRIR